MPSSSSALFIVGNLAAIVFVTMAGCLAADTVASFLGYRTVFFCSGIGLAVAGAHYVGVMLTTFGLLLWAVSMFRSETGLGLAVGGVLLAVLPQILPHYLGAVC